MKQRTKVMLSSLAAIAMSASLAVGATYALFTSETQVDISVSSGSVNVDATAKNLELYSRGLKQENGTFEVGGTATLVENVITIERMVPMDSVKFDIVIENYSDVSVQYRTIVKEMEDTGLFSGLNVSFTGRKTNKAKFEGASSYSDWALVAPQDTNPATAEHIQTVGVTIELPEKAGNEYQNKSCKLVVIVEAVQANADVHSGVAKVGDKSYATLEEALKVAQPDDVVEMLHPGVYAPFTIDTEDVTVKGIVSDTKLESTVFQVMGNNMINLGADGVTVDSIWVETVDGEDKFPQAAFNPYISWSSGAHANYVTITNSKIYGNNKVGMAMLYCEDTLTFTNNYVDGFETAVYSACDNGGAVSYTITGNTTNDVTALFDGYWGVENTTGGTNIVVTDNKANDETLIRLWDFAYNAAGTAVNAEVKDNTNAKVMLTRGKTGATVAPVETEVIYQNVITVTGFDGVCQVTNVKGDTYYNEDLTTGDGNGLRLVVGEYTLTDASATYEFTVEQDTFEITKANAQKVYYVTNDTELLAAIDNEGGKTDAVTIYLADGTYAENLTLIPSNEMKQTGDLTFKAVNGKNANVVFTGLISLGWRVQGTGANAWNSNVAFYNVTFDREATAEEIAANTDSQHSIYVGSVKSLTLDTCKIIGVGEYGIGSSNQNTNDGSKIMHCTFENAGMQIKGNFGGVSTTQPLVIDDCTFNNSRINVQGGHAITVQNCTFNATLTSVHVGDSFYMIRSNNIPMNIVGCKINIDSALTEVATAQAKWALLWSRQGGPWTVSDVKINLTAAAVQQTELRITYDATNNNKITCNNVTVNGNAYVQA